MSTGRHEGYSTIVFPLLAVGLGAYALISGCEAAGSTENAPAPQIGGQEQVQVEGSIHHPQEIVTRETMVQISIAERGLADTVKIDPPK